MKAILIAAAATGLLAAPALAESNMNKMTPGHEMQEHGSKAGSPGASGYAPGHEMKSGRSDSDGSGIKGDASGRASGAGGDRTGGVSGSASGSATGSVR